MYNLHELQVKLLQIRTLADECLRELGRHPKENRKSKKNPAHVANPAPQNLDFSKPVRPFMKSYSQGMNGQKKFTLLLARLAKGDLAKGIPLTEIETHWKKMTAIMEMDFNRYFTSKARDEDWVESLKGSYKLRPGWKAIFK